MNNCQQKKQPRQIDWRVVLRVAAMLFLIDFLLALGATVLFQGGGGTFFIPGIYVPLKPEFEYLFWLAVLASVLGVLGVPFLGGFYSGWKAKSCGGMHGFYTAIIERSVLSLIMFGYFVWESGPPPLFMPGVGLVGKVQLVVGQIFGVCLMALVLAGLPGYISGRLGELKRIRSKPQPCKSE
jgi:hypothetical protein